MAKTHEGLTHTVPQNALETKRIFTTVAGIKIRKENGRYQYQPPSLKFTCTHTLDQNFPHLRDNRLYFNLQACLDNLLDEVEWRTNWQNLESSTVEPKIKFSSKG